MLGLAVQERAANRIVHSQRAVMFTPEAPSHEWSEVTWPGLVRGEGGDKQALRVDFDLVLSVGSKESSSARMNWTSFSIVDSSFQDSPTGNFTRLENRISHEKKLETWVSTRNLVFKILLILTYFVWYTLFVNVSLGYSN